MTLRHRRVYSLLAAGLLAATIATVPAAEGAHCGPGQFSVSGIVTDALTGLPLDRVTSVGYSLPDGTPFDGDGTDPATSTFDSCLPAGSYIVNFFADDYYIEWYNDSLTQAGALVIMGAEGEHVSNIHAALTPFPVITGRVTDSRTGEPLFTSVGLTNAVTGLGLDGEGTDANGVYRFVLNPDFYPVPGSYKVHFSADSHWSEWFDNSKKKSKATVISITPASGVVSGVDAELRPCRRPSPDFCIPRGFSS